MLHPKALQNGYLLFVLTIKRKQTYVNIVAAEQILISEVLSQTNSNSIHSYSVGQYDLRMSDNNEHKRIKAIRFCASSDNESLIVLLHSAPSNRFFVLNLILHLAQHSSSRRRTSLRFLSCPKQVDASISGAI